MLLNIHIYAVLNIHVIHENKVCNVACNLMVKWCDVRMFTTEILEGFDVQRTRDMNETVQKYGELTHAIMDRYLLESGKPNTPPNAVCPTFGEFVEHCKDFDMERVSDVFGVSTDASKLHHLICCRSMIVVALGKGESGGIGWNDTVTVCQ